MQRNGGTIERNNDPSSILEERQSIRLDRCAIGLSALGDKENLFNKNAPIFDSPGLTTPRSAAPVVMYEIENSFKEIEII